MAKKYYNIKITTKNNNNLKLALTPFVRRMCVCVCLCFCFFVCYFIAAHRQHNFLWSHVQHTETHTLSLIPLPKPTKQNVLKIPKNSAIFACFAIINIFCKISWIQFAFGRMWSATAKQPTRYKAQTDKQAKTQFGHFICFCCDT